MRDVTRLLVPLALVLCLVPSSLGQSSLPPGVTISEGTGHGVQVLLEGVDIGEAGAPATALDVDPARPLNITVRISPPEGVDAWEIRSFSVGLLVAGPGSEPPAALRRDVPTQTKVPANYTVTINRTVTLGDIENLGAGVFLMQATVLDRNGTALSAQSFYVRVAGNPLFTASGAAVTALSIATGYGLWQVLKDLNELREAYKRHRKRKAEARRRSLDVVEMAENAAENTLARAGRPAAEIVEIRRAADEAERSLGPVRWTATFCGLGVVTMAWLQFLGYVAFNAVASVMMALEFGAAGLTIALLGNALLKRYRASARTRTLVPEEPAAAAPETLVK